MSDITVAAYQPPVVSVSQPIKWATKDVKKRSKDYVLSLLPIITWIHKYNLSWALRDLVAGVTVGIVVVPQSLSYAQVAGLPLAYGLYSSFIGVLLYCLFATSKDVSIGPVAVMSAQTYTVIHNVLKRVPSLTEADAPMIASALSLLCGGITFGIGILRLGFILEYISMPCVLGFMTGSAFTIAAGQVPSLMGYNKEVKTSGATYLVIVETLKHLPDTKLDAAFGLVCLFILFVMKFGCDYLAKRDVRRRIFWFYLGTMRSALVIIFSTLIAWGVCRHSRKADGSYPISLVKTVPRGLRDVGVHPVDRRVVDAFAPDLPISVVVLVLEHIAISKSFGRINEYRINPNQELIAIGVSNMVGHFFNAYPNTGSFSRSALKAKCGVKTPLAGIWTGICVIVALYGLTDAFYWISKASLAAIIIHAVVDLVASWRSTYKFWLISPLECIIFLVDIILCIFVSLEAGIYFSVAASLLFVLLRQTFPLGQFLGKVEFNRVTNPRIESKQTDNASSINQPASSIDTENSTEQPELGIVEEEQTRTTDSSFRQDKDDNREVARRQSLSDSMRPPPHAGPVVQRWWPLTHDNINPNVRIVPPPPGIFVYRFRDALTYQNCSWQMERVIDYMRKHTRRNLSQEALRNIKLGDRKWNDGLPRNLIHVKGPVEVDTRPVLRAIVFDMTCTPHVDLTAANALYDAHQELTKYAAQPIEFHFAGIMSEWAQRALIYGGFGGSENEALPWSPPSVDVGASTPTDASFGEKYDVEAQKYNTDTEAITDTRRFYFHLDIPDLE